jgi:hypothetical protein
MAKLIFRLKTHAGVEIEQRAEVVTVADVSKLLKKAEKRLSDIRRVIPAVMEAKLATVSLRLEQAEEKERAASAA